MTKKLLIVDDEERIRELVQACLEDLGGWDTLTAASGSEGLKIAQMEPIDAILLDVSMPDMDGFAVYEKLQANSGTEAIPVILLTAKVQGSDIAPVSPRWELLESSPNLLNPPLFATKLVRFWGGTINN
ncbi:Response regulator with CheY-like receiver, AAA-type ATPase, and DNA-binding domains [Nostoc sp. DSM 114167]|jgi:CheY-like chemotaxis protein